MGPMGRAMSARQRGQVLVVFALGVAGLLAAAGVAIDVGRFYSERRFLQNAADAAALAAANALIRGESQAVADDAARDTLARNFLGDPNGVVASLPPTTPVYESGHAGDPSYLSNGILISGCDIRVAVRNDISYTFGRVVGLGNQPIGARARVDCYGDLLPIAVRRFVNTPGPNSGATWPCSDNPSWFTDYFATAETSCLGSETDAALRSAPNPGADFDSLDPGSDTANHGPVLAILGQGAQPNNGADFRGFVALDIRNFQSAGSQLYYNGVTTSTNSNTLKAMEAGWFKDGYPGPLFPSIVSPPDPGVVTRQAYAWLGRGLTMRGTMPKLWCFCALCWSPSGSSLRNDFEAAVFRRHPRLARIKRELLEQGAADASLAGSGSAVFGVFPNPAQARRAARKFPEDRVFHCATLSRKAYSRALWGAAGPLWQSRTDS